jgi:hypothetical protein
MGVHVIRQVSVGSPGSDGASPYLLDDQTRRDLDVDVAERYATVLFLFLINR